MKQVLPLGQLRWVVDRLHVSTTDDEVMTEITKRMPRNRFTQQQIDEAVTFALQVHRENRELYTMVMTGSLN
jgi:hypothetical protein